MSRNPCESSRQHLVRDRLPSAVAHDVDHGERAAVTIGAGGVLAQLNNALTREHRFEGGAGGKTSLGPRPGFAGGGRERNFNGGEANLASVLQDETAPVADRTNLSCAGDFEPTSAQRPVLRARGRRQDDGANRA